MKADEFDQVLKMKRVLEELGDRHAADVTLDGTSIVVKPENSMETGIFGGKFGTVEEATAYLQGMTAGKRVADYLGRKADRDEALGESP